MITFLKISSVIFILSLFSYNELILTSALTLFIIAVVLNCAKLWKGQDILNLVDNKTYDNGVKYLKEGKYFTAIINFLIFPAVIVGVAFAILDLYCMWLMVIK